jgi:hypothetical protein
VCSEDLDASLLEEDEEYLESGGSRCNSSGGHLLDSRGYSHSVDSVLTDTSAHTLVVHISPGVGGSSSSRIAGSSSGGGGSVMLNSMRWSPLPVSADSLSINQQHIGDRSDDSTGSSVQNLDFNDVISQIQ